jgi:hypothetical protein
MDFIDKLRELSARIPKQLDYIQTEEATKNALVLPFLNALGYNVFDPTEVTPELTADVGMKKGEKVDYAILREGSHPLRVQASWRRFGEGASISTLSLLWCNGGTFWGANQRGTLLVLH